VNTAVNKIEECVERKLDVLEKYGCDATTRVAEHAQKILTRPDDVRVLCLDEPQTRLRSADIAGHTRNKRQT